MTRKALQISFIMFVLISMTSCLNNKKTYQDYFDILKMTPFDKFLGWQIFQRENEGCYYFRYSYKPLTNTDSLKMNKENECELVFAYCDNKLMFYPLHDTSISDNEHYSNFADALNVSDKGIRDTISNFINLFYFTKSTRIKSDAQPSNFIYFFFEDGEIILTYITDSISSELKNDVINKQNRINDNWYYEEYKKNAP